MAWRTQTSIFSSIYGMDPYADWLLNQAWDEFSRKSDFSKPGPFIPFVVALLSEEARTIMENSSGGNESPAPKLPIFIPKLNSRFVLGSHISAFAPRQFFVDLATSSDPLYVKFRNAVKRIKLGLPLKADQQQPSGKTVGMGAKLKREAEFAGFIDVDRSAIIAIIDDGIAFAHDRFRADPTHTRVAYFWRQDGRFDAASVGGAVASTVPYGREISADDGPSTRPGINTLLTKYTHGGIVDEDQVYAEFGEMKFADARDHKPVAQRWAHGTHVLDLAAGFPIGKGGSDRPIIAVQLPVATTADTSGSTLEVYVKHALNYIYDRANQIDKTQTTPLVINFSYGVTAGPHDGTSIVEQEIESSLNITLNKQTKRPVAFVLPSGNAQLSRDHASICWNGDATDPDANPAELCWRVQPNNLTTSHLEIWLPPGVGATDNCICVEVETPDGQPSGYIGQNPGQGVALRAPDGTVLAAMSYTYEVAPTERGLFLISLRPTDHLSRAGRKRNAMAGVWSVRVRRGTDYNGERIDAWIQRNDTPFGYPIRARQSYFDETPYLRYDPISGRPIEEDDPSSTACYVKRVSLINAIATSCSPVVVGGVYRQTLKPADYSAGGPTWTVCGKTPRIGPDLAAVSDDSRIHRGVLGAGSRSGSCFALSGTSVAAPQIARQAAADQADRKKVLQDAKDQESASPQPRPTIEPIREGGGRLILDSHRLPRIVVD
jgi:hypothetical protein